MSFDDIVSIDDNVIPNSGKYVIYKEEIYLVSSTGVFQLLPELSPGIGYKFLESNLSIVVLLKSGKIINESTVLNLLFKPMQERDKINSNSLISSMQKLRIAAENTQIKTANPNRLEVHWEKK